MGDVSKNPNVKLVKSFPKDVFEKYIYEDKLSGGELSRLFGVSGSFMNRWLHSLGLKPSGLNFDKFAKFNIHKFDVIDTEEKAFWLGFIFADGCVVGEHTWRLCIKLAEKDYNHLKKFKDFMEDTRGDHRIRRVVEIKDGKEFVSYSYEVSNKTMINTLINLGCVPKKSLILKFPDESIFARKELVYDFIRGYIDGDGCITTNGKKGRMQIYVLGTEHFLNGIRNYFPQFSKLMKKNNIYAITCNSNMADQVGYKLYENATIYLDRKRERYTALCWLHNSEKSDKIGESCDANAEVTPEIAKGSESTVENSE